MFSVASSLVPVDWSAKSDSYSQTVNRTFALWSLRGDVALCIFWGEKQTEVEPAFRNSFY